MSSEKVFSYFFHLRQKQHIFSNNSAMAPVSFSNRKMKVNKVIPIE